MAQISYEELSKPKYKNNRFQLLKENGHIGSISEEERKRALKGERIDHHLTDFEATVVWSIENKDTFNKNSTPKGFCYLYGWRKDKELEDYYFSISTFFENIPLNHESDYREVIDYEG